MSDSDDLIVIRLYVLPGVEETAMVAFPRDAWEQMSPAQRKEWLDKKATHLMEDRVERGWIIISGADNSEVDDS